MRTAEGLLKVCANNNNNNSYWIESWSRPVVTWSDRWKAVFCHNNAYEIDVSETTMYQGKERQTGRS